MVKPEETAEDLRQTVKEIGQLNTRRNRLIRQRQKQGASMRQIAAEADLHHSGVAKILAAK